MATPEIKSNGNGAPQLTWSVVIAAVLAFCALSGGFFAIIQNQFNSSDRRIDANLKEIELIRLQFLTLREHAAYQHEQETINIALRNRLTALENKQSDLIAHGARTPIEAREMDQLSASFDKQISSLRSQIDDINRQIAASILHPPPIQSVH